MRRHRLRHAGSLLIPVGIVAVIGLIAYIAYRRDQGFEERRLEDRAAYEQTVADLNEKIARLSEALTKEQAATTARGDQPVTSTPAQIAGTPGPAGAVGETGARGEQGMIGPRGAVGPPGPVGAAGAAGKDGAPGVAGPVGPAGKDGASGPAGPAGPAGPQGDTGAAGATGPQGEPGPAGPQGAQGVAGPAGPPGQSVRAFTFDVGPVHYTCVDPEGDGTAGCTAELPPP